ncbi:MAG: SDR family NAD(P)-dependent oxidoreductase, partial [Candidatus Omnitrophota bacterium]|nr:SDR family NAD(P)-dependent oxidoreductase [Candidatus Omnitrophota bacterium]
MVLKDKVAIVTGGARGIGREIALLFAMEGADIAICDVNAEALNSAQAEIGVLGRRALTAVVDVTKSDQVESFVQKTLDKFKKIDILVNNAGITRDSLLVRMSDADWDLVLAVNLKGAFNCTRAVTKIMMKQRDGRIVNIASIIG